MTGPATDDVALTAAVDWHVRQESAALDAHEREAFERWLAADSRNRAAWARVDGLLQAPLSAVQAFRARGQATHTHAAAQALVQARRRRVLRGALALAGSGGALALLADRETPLRQLTADLRTATGERREFPLGDDRTTVLLDARSAVDVQDALTLHLRAGALIASRTAQSPAPLRVITRDGDLSLQDGRVMCRLHDHCTEAVALDHAVVLQPRSGAPVVLGPGEGAYLSHHGTRRLPGNPADRAAWREGMLAAEDWSLGEVIDALRAYSTAYMRVSPDAAALRVFGIFRLEVDHVLDTLAYTLPIRARRVGPWLTAIDLDPDRRTG